MHPEPRHWWGQSGTAPTRSVRRRTRRRHKAPGRRLRKPDAARGPGAVPGLPAARSAGGYRARHLEAPAGGRFDALAAAPSGPRGRLRLGGVPPPPVPGRDRQLQVPDPDLDLIDERSARLNQLLRRAGDRLVYEYDFGDSWVHEVVFEELQRNMEASPIPRCHAGSRAAPPVDSGGVHGYAELVQALADPTHPEHDEQRTWAGQYDPERFDADAINGRLARLRRVRAGASFRFRSPASHPPALGCGCLRSAARPPEPDPAATGRAAGILVDVQLR